jgi:hypothetical protein
MRGRRENQINLKAARLVSNKAHLPPPRLPSPANIQSPKTKKKKKEKNILVGVFKLSANSHDACSINNTVLYR